MGEPMRKHEEAVHEEEVFEKDKPGWWETDKVDAVGWALAFIWGGFVLLLNGTELAKNIDWWNGWGAFFVGAGVITISLALLRLVINYRTSQTTGGVIFGLILLGIGFGDLVAVWFWPLVLTAIGLSLLISVVRSNR